MKKLIVFCILVVAGISFCYTRYSVNDVVAYAQAKKDPKWSPMLEYYSGYYLEMKDRHEEAISTLEALLETFPDCEYKGHAIFRLGTAYENSRNIPKAKELYEQYLEENPRGEFSELAQRKIDLFKST